MDVELVDVELVDVELAGLLGAPEGVDSTEEEEALERGWERFRLFRLAGDEVIEVYMNANEAA